MRHLKYLTGACAVLVIVTLALWKIGKQPTFQFFGDLLYRINTSEKVVALTFDDGPSTNNTEDVLKILRENGIRATFFMIGKNIAEHPELAKRVLQEGHQIANHSYSHQRMLLQSVDFCKEEIEKTDYAIRNLGYNDEIVFRPPYGKKLFSLPLAAKQLNKLTVTWDAESEDTEYQDVDILLSHVRKKAREGSIILFHDGGDRKEGTLATLRILIPELRKKGFQFTTINELRKRAPASR